MPRGLLVLAYFIEGAVRAWGDAGTAAWLARIEVALATTFFVSAIGYVRRTRRSL